MGGNNMEGRKLYCHFSFRRREYADGVNKGKYGIFACAFYRDEDDRKAIAKFVEAHPLWEDQQYICAIQSFKYVLEKIWENQKELIERNVTEIWLVTDNSTLRKWIEKPNKNKEYKDWMAKAYSGYMVGRTKEIKIRLKIAEAVKYEKSYKYCKEEFLDNKIPEPVKEVGEGAVYKVNAVVRSVTDIIKDMGEKEENKDVTVIDDNAIDSVLANIEVE